MGNLCVIEGLCEGKDRFSDHISNVLFSLSLFFLNLFSVSLLCCSSWQCRVLVRHCENARLAVADSPHLALLRISSLSLFLSFFLSSSLFLSRVAVSPVALSSTAFPLKREIFAKGTIAFDRFISLPYGLVIAVLETEPAFPETELAGLARRRLSAAFFRAHVTRCHRRA